MCLFQDSLISLIPHIALREKACFNPGRGCGIRIADWLAQLRLRIDLRDFGSGLASRTGF
jgi:hypothetical protein